MSSSSIRAFAIIALLIFAFSAQFAFGNPMQTMRLFAADDNVQDTIIARSGVFDPSDSYMTWADTIYCDNTYSYYTVYLEYRGTNISHSYQTSNLTPGSTYTAGDGPVWVGPSNSHELVMRKSSIGNKNDLRNLRMRVYYYAGGAD
jgi:hypothetical protein